MSSIQEQGAVRKFLNFCSLVGHQISNAIESFFSGIKNAIFGKKIAVNLLDNKSCEIVSRKCIIDSINAEVKWAKDACSDFYDTLDDKIMRIAELEGKDKFEGPEDVLKSMEADIDKLNKEYEKYAALDNRSPEQENILESIKCKKSKTEKEYAELKKKLPEKRVANSKSKRKLTKDEKKELKELKNEVKKFKPKCDELALCLNVKKASYFLIEFLTGKKETEAKGLEIFLAERENFEKLARKKLSECLKKQKEIFNNQHKANTLGKPHDELDKIYDEVDKIQSKLADMPEKLAKEYAKELIRKHKLAEECNKTT
jgi:hypothetical protein